MKTQFFQKYSEMPRSIYGLEGAGEWPALQAILPDFHGCSMLDLGCGYGWHCKYAANHGALHVTGIDLSVKNAGDRPRKKTQILKSHTAALLWKI